MNGELMRKLPKVDFMLGRDRLREAAARYPYAVVKDTLNAVLTEIREKILAGGISSVPGPDDIEETVLHRLEEGSHFSLRRVINGTGVILHTNLGRAPLGGEVLDHLKEVLSGYSNLEYDLSTGRRGSRYSHVEEMLCRVTGAEAAIVVNNNAAAVFLMLNTLAKDRKTAVSRGELVEIGGSFRMPDIMGASGTELVEVGTTNRTRLSDYADAVRNRNVSVLLKVHRSNFLISGFTEETEIRELRDLALEEDCILLFDCGAAFAYPPETVGLREGITARKAIREGADVVCFSADKLFGSAQAGIIAGRKACIDRIRKNQLTRMMRIDKLSLAALETALLYCRDPKLAAEKIPALRMMASTEEECRERAERLKKRIIEEAPGLDVSVTLAEDEIGGGAIPGVVLPGAAVSVGTGSLSGEEADRVLRGLRVPLVTRIKDRAVLISVRTVEDGEFDDAASACAALAARIREHRVEV